MVWLVLVWFFSCDFAFLLSFRPMTFLQLGLGHSILSEVFSQIRRQLHGQRTNWEEIKLHLNKHHSS